MRRSCYWPTTDVDDERKPRLLAAALIVESVVSGLGKTTGVGGARERNTFINSLRLHMFVFLDQELISYRFSSCCCCSSFCCGDSLQNATKASSFQIGSQLNSTQVYYRDEIWQECSSSKYASIDRVEFSIWHQTFQMAVMISFHEEKCCHLVSTHVAHMQ